MSLQMFVTFSDSNKKPIQIEGQEILETLGGHDEKIAIRLKEVLETVKEAVNDVLDQEGELQIEISGSLDLKATGGINYLLFNISGEATKNNTMKVSLTTKIMPK